MTTRLGGSTPPLMSMDSLSFDMQETHDAMFYEEDERIDEMSSQEIQTRDTMFTSLCAVFSNGLNPIVPPLVRRHSSRWRIGLSVVIGIMTFTASFAHLRYMMHHGNDRRVEERRQVLKSMRSLRFFGGNPVQPPAQLQTSTEKEDANPRVLLGMTVTCWSVWAVLVATHPYVKRRTVAVGEGSERSIATCIVFILACILTHWTRIRYGEAAIETDK